MYSGVRANHQQQIPINYLLEYCGHSPSSAKIHFLCSTRKKYNLHRTVTITNWRGEPHRNSKGKFNIDPKIVLVPKSKK